MKASDPNPAKPWEHAKKTQGSGADPAAAKFVESLSFDRRLYRHDIAGSIVHAQMLEKAGLLAGDDLARIEAGLKQIEAEIDQDPDDWSGWKVDLEDVHMCIESALIEKIGDAGRKLHTARSRNDQVALDLKLWIHEAVAAVQVRLDAVYHAFVTMADRDGEIVMPAYTHLQKAQPIVVGAELLSWLSALDRAEQRLLALQTVDRCNPLGAGAVAGSSLPIDREQTARALAVGPPSTSSIDATANRDAAIDLVYSLAMIAMTLSRWAEQWIFYTSGEVGFLTLDDRHTTGSSMMPQKRNPDMLELIRGRCGGVYGHLVALLTICKGLPIGYSRDLQLDKQHVFDAYDSVVDCLDMTGRIVAAARFNRGAIAVTLGKGFLDATSLAEYLVSRGVAFRTAHQIVGRLVLRCEQEQRAALSDLSVDQINKACAAAGAGQPADQGVADWLGVQNVVKRYRSFGNGGCSGFKQQIESWKQRLHATS